MARDLLGKVLVHRSEEGVTAGTIVEVEAYIGEDDPACHAAPGPTARNQPLYGAPGHAYVYINYGVHLLFNVVTEQAGAPAAVLVRALDPVEGIDLMRRRRAKWARSRTSGARPSAHMADADLCRGPRNLTRAMGITLADNREDLCSGRRLYVEDRGLEIGHATWSRRIGINVGVERPWRCYVTGHAAVSGSRAKA